MRRLLRWLSGLVVDRGFLCPFCGAEALEEGWSGIFRCVKCGKLS